MDDLINYMGIVQSSVVRGSLEDEYLFDWQIGSQEDMTPGLVDVSQKRLNFLPAIIKLVSTVWWCIPAQGSRVSNGGGKFKVRPLLFLPD